MKVFIQHDKYTLFLMCFLFKLSSAASRATGRGFAYPYIMYLICPDQLVIIYSTCVHINCL